MTSVTFGSRRRVVPNQNLGQDSIAQRRLAEAAGRAAQHTRTSVRVDAHPCRLYLRNVRGTLPCPCCVDLGGGVTGGAPVPRVFLDGGEFDDVQGVESGYPRGNERYARDHPGEMQPRSSAEDRLGTSLAQILLGTQRRCGICWGTGWLDGYRMWGGNRRIMCVMDAPGVTLLGDPTLDVDVNGVAPAMLGPGQVTWSVRINHADRHLDALRVRNQLLPADDGAYLLQASRDGVAWSDPASVLSYARDPSAGVHAIRTGTVQFRLTLANGARVTHAELVSRSEPLVSMQLPQLQQAASAELVAPFLSEEFEVDPVVGYVERGSVMDVQPRDGRIGMVWTVTDVMNKQTAAGQVFGIVGTVRSTQPMDTIAVASMSDALRSGLMERGYGTRGLEATGMGVPVGLGDVSEHDAASARRGSPQRLGGGTSQQGSTIVLSTGDYRDDG